MELRDELLRRRRGSIVVFLFLLTLDVAGGIEEKMRSDPPTRNALAWQALRPTTAGSSLGEQGKLRA
jgi:hypothetical protein